MCQHCNGTHVVHTHGEFYTMISTCPDCGPVSEQVQSAKLEAIRNRINEARTKLAERKEF